MMCASCAKFIQPEDLRAFLYYGMEHIIHIECANHYLKRLIPDNTPIDTAQLIREDILAYIQGTAPETHTKYKVNKNR